MHRLASIPGGSGAADAGALVEQPAAPVLLLSSADTDLLAIDQLLEREPDLLGVELRGLNLAALTHPAQVDHYLSTTVCHSRLVLVRLLGGRGHWNYGLERLQHWAADQPDRQLLVLAGTEEEELALAELGTAPVELSIALAHCLREGGPPNLRVLLETLRDLLAGDNPQPPVAVHLADPLPHDWRPEPGPRVGVIAYRALLQAGDLALMKPPSRPCAGPGSAPGPCG
jgi:cobaltochelatase CobN